MEYRGGTVLAIDQNTKSGMAEGLPGSTPRLETINFEHDETDTPEDLYERVLFYFAERFRTDPPGLVAIERVVPPSAARGKTNHSTTLITLGIYALIVGIVRCKSIPLMTVSVGTWRKSFLGRGNLKGDVAKREAVKLCARLGWDAPDHNAAEAAGLWHHACAVAAPYGVTTLHPALFAERVA